MPKTSRSKPSASKNKTPPNWRQSIYQLLNLVRKLLPKRRWLRRLVVGLFVFIAVSGGTMYGIARWYIASERSKPLTLGVTFIADYAQQLGVDPHQTLQALIGQLGVRNFRLVS